MSRRLVQGQIRWLETPAAKRRPALIVSRDVWVDRLSDVLVIPLTTTIREIPTEIEMSRADGLARECVANAQQIKEVPHTDLGEPLGQLAPGRWHEVCNAVAIAIGC